MLRTEALERLSHFLGIQLRMNRGLDILGQFFRFAQVIQRNGLALPTIVIDDQIVGKTVQPGEEGYPALLVPIDRFPGLEKYLFGQIFGLARRIDPIVDVPVDPIEARLVQLPERVGISLNGPRNQATFVVNWATH